MADVQHAFILGGGQANIALDIVEAEEHSSDLEVTDNPVETGVVVSDHAFMKPYELSIRGVVSDTPLHGYDPQTGQLLQDRFYSTKGTRSASAWSILRDLQRSAQPISYQSGLELHENLVIVNLSVDHDVSTANGLPIRMRLREVIRRSTKTVTYPPRATGKPHRQASKKVDGGEKKTTPETDQTKVKSAAVDLLGIGTPQAVAIGNTAPDLDPDLKKFYGPGSGLPD
jgi:hypothetical protein